MTVASGFGADPVLATLRVRSGLPGSPVVPVRAAQATVGSDPASDVVLAGEGVAPRHGQLRLRGGVWTYTDFGSVGGSTVDGHAVHGEALLAPGSSVRVGEVALAFAPSDRWEDSPPERRLEERTPLLVVPNRRTPYWPSIAFLIVLAAAAIVAYLLLRNS
jgi:pSer/pThr/pTyr-binding forkhead associated (FHA) protein